MLEIILTSSITSVIWMTVTFFAYKKITKNAKINRRLSQS